LKGTRKNVAAVLAFSLSLFFSRKSRLLGCVPQVKHLCKRSQIADSTSDLRML